MTVHHGKWPLPEGHPFKGTRIIFGAKRHDSSQKSSSNTPNEDQVKLFNLMEEAHQDRILKAQESTTAKKKEPSSQIPPTEKETK